MGNLYIVRHGTTALNSDPNNPDQKEKLRGWENIPLSDAGWALVEKSANILRSKNIIKIYASDLKRTMETADAVSQTTSAPVTAVFALRSWNIGKLSGLPAEAGNKLLKLLITKHPTAQVPGGESYQEFYDRWEHALLNILLACKELPENKSLCIVTHSRNIFSLEHILSRGKKPIVFDEPVSPGGIIEFDFVNNKINKIFDEKTDDVVSS